MKRVVGERTGRVVRFQDFIWAEIKPGGIPRTKPFTTLHTASEADATLHRTLHHPSNPSQPFVERIEGFNDL
jgi:hypothetical protein